MERMRFLLGLLFAVVFLSSQAARAQETQNTAYPPSPSDFGGMGLLQTRTARVARDGNFEVGFSRIFPYERYLVTIQALPWLEGTFRYTSVTNRAFSGGPGGDTGTSFKDRGADLKFVLAREGRLTPAVALGLQDGLGTGVFSGEYLVASKRIFDFDLSLGLGWGYLAGDGNIKNPLGNISDAFKSRTGGGQQGGTLLATNYFSGPNIGIFGGIEYATPLKGLSLKVEYDPNSYEIEPLANPLRSSSHINYGLVYEPFPWINASLARERGEELMFRVTLRANLNDSGIPKFDPPPPALVPRPADPVTVRQARFEQGSIGSDSSLTASLQEEGLRPRWVRVENGNIAVGLDSSDEAQMRRAGKLAASYLPSVDGLVTVTDTSGRLIQVSNEEAQRDLPVDFLFDELSQRGIDLGEVSVVGGRMIIEANASITDAATISGIAALAFPDTSVEVVNSAGTLLAFRDASSGADPKVLAESRRGIATLGAPAGAASGAAGSLVRWPYDVQKATAEAVFKEASTQGLVIDGVVLSGARVTVYLARGPFRQGARNVGRAMIVAANNAPASIEEIEVVSASAGMETGRITIRRKDLEAAMAQNGTGSVEEMWNHALVTGPGRRDPDAIEPDGALPRFSYAISPALRQNIGSGDRFYLYQIFLRLSGALQLSRGLSVDGAVGADIYNNFDRLTAPPDSALPNVRSNIKRYLQEGENNLIRLQTTYLWSPFPDNYLRASAGYFEENYGGYSAEYLYRPFGARFAAGFDINYVRQRDFDQRLTFQDYSVTTGHLNIYYDIPFYDLLGQLHIGQYLAGDKGATFQVSRRFDNGMRAGAFFTLTDVPFAVFGEGSFDKGFFLTIPLELFSTSSSTNVGLFAFRPLTRDGGQRLAVRPRLYDITAGGNLGELARDWSRIFE